MLKVTPGFAGNYIPEALKVHLPPSLPSYFKPQLVGRNIDAVSEEVRRLLPLLLTMTENQSVAIERLTTEQSKSKFWQTWRAGRITASKAFEVAKTNLTNPASSLVKAICYPEAYTFSTEAARL